jgi:N-acetylmuramoyl-L-alanine amidase
MRITAVIFLLVTFTAAAQKQNDSFLLARTSARLAMLAYSLGEDRLGGAKLGYLDTAVLLKITDSSKELYHVQLSKFHHAYINKSDLAIDTATIQHPFYFTSSLSVKGDEMYDYVSIALNEKLPYKSWMELEPSKIFLEIYGVQSNASWISQLRSVKEIKEVYCNQAEDDVVRVTIELKHKQHWGYSVYYNNNKLCLRVRRRPATLKANKLMIAVDAGHGGNDNGAVGVNSKGFEKMYTLRFANELEKYLKKKKVSVLMTRTSDTTINNTDRVLMLQNAMPDIAVSLHFNSSANAEVKGAATYYNRVGFRSLSTSLLSRLLQLELSEFGNIGNSDYRLNAPTDFPNSVVEVAFLSNGEDEKQIINPRFQKSVAKKIYKAIKDWLRIVKE